MRSTNSRHALIENLLKESEFRVKSLPDKNKDNTATGTQILFLLPHYSFGSKVDLISFVSSSLTLLNYLVSAGSETDHCSKFHPVLPFLQV